MATSPGTVSKILWHFTGGPNWDEDKQRPEESLKPAEEALATLISIIKSKTLRLGGYKESFGDPDDARRLIPSIPVCCLADIPIIHLHYHAKRYGRIAIGFHRSSAIKHRFCPVFYQRHQTDVSHYTHELYANIKLALECYEKSSTQDPEVGTHLNRANSHVCNLVSYVKTFRDSEYDSIYTEREWRSERSFNFDNADIAMIVVPREGEFFERFVAVAASESLSIPRSIPIVPWEDLIEH